MTDPNMIPVDNSVRNEVIRRLVERGYTIGKHLDLILELKNRGKTADQIYVIVLEEKVLTGEIHHPRIDE